MKEYVGLLSLAVIWIAPSALAWGHDGQSFVSINPDHSNALYSEGEHAVILFQNLQWPTNPNFSVNVEISFTQHSLRFSLADRSHLDRRTSSDTLRE